VNVVASVLARLRNHSKSNGAPFQQVLQQYAIERFLYRISKSKHAQSVILKGALLLKTVGIPRSRPTVDIDMLRKGNADQTSLLALVKDCATLDVEADGLTFLADSAVAEEITKDSEYKGTRILMDGTQRSANCASAPSEGLLPNLLPKAGRRGDSRGRRAPSFQQLTDFHLRLRGFESHPLRHLNSNSFLRLESLRSFPTASLLPNSGDFRGRITICCARMLAKFTAEIPRPES
jgi:hypothetical protein